MNRGFDVVIIDEAAQAVRYLLKIAFMMEHLRCQLGYLCIPHASILVDISEL